MHVLERHAEQLGALMDVADDDMGLHHAFRVAGRARGVDDGGEAIRIQRLDTLGDRVPPVAAGLVAELDELLLVVHDPSNYGSQPFGKQRIEAMYAPGGDTYSPVSGVWQPVWLESVPSRHIRSLSLHDFQRDASTEVFGELSVMQWLRSFYRHDRQHTAQIEGRRSDYEPNFQSGREPNQRRMRIEQVARRGQES